jgi:hypothetical protein
MKRQACPRIEFLHNTARIQLATSSSWLARTAFPSQVKMNQDSCCGYISVANTPSALLVIYEN